MFKDRIKVHTSSSGTQYVDIADARALQVDLDSMIRERLKELRNKMWVVGQFIKVYDDGNVAWEFQGVFSGEEKAIEACKDEWYYFYFPVQLDQEFPKESVTPEGVVYPNQAYISQLEE